MCICHVGGCGNISAQPAGQRHGCLAAWVTGGSLWPEGRVGNHGGPGHLPVAAAHFCQKAVLWAIVSALTHVYIAVASCKRTVCHIVIWFVLDSGTHAQ